MEDDVARNLEQEVSDEKDARTQPINGLTEPQIVQHLEFGETHIHTIEIGRAVAAEQQGKHAPGDAVVKSRFGKSGFVHV